MDLLTKYLNLGPLDEHPLPWYPPFCSTAAKDLHVPTVDHLQGVITAGKKSATAVAELSLRPTLMELAGNPVGQSDADVGQRINTLISHVWSTFFERLTTGKPSKFLNLMSHAVKNQNSLNQYHYFV